MRAASPAPPVLNIRGELAGILERFDEADKRLRRAAAHEAAKDIEAAEMERLKALGDRYAAGLALADLFLLLLRQVQTYRPDAMQLYLGELLRPHLEPFADAVVGLEVRR
jgi:hypothetical protein